MINALQKKFQLHPLNSEEAEKIISKLRNTSLLFIKGDFLVLGALATIVTLFQLKPSDILINLENYKGLITTIVNLITAGLVFETLTAFFNFGKDHKVNAVRVLFLKILFVGVIFWHIGAITFLQGYASVANPKLNLAYMYMNGEQDFKQSYAKAFELMHEIDDEGGKAPLLGFFYEEGLGVKQNSKLAAKYYLKYAQQGNLFAQLRLGSCYQKGQGVKKNLQEAYLWLTLGLDENNRAKAQEFAQSNFEAAKNRDKIAKTLTTEQIVFLQKRIKEWKPIPAI